MASAAILLLKARAISIPSSLRRFFSVIPATKSAPGIPPPFAAEDYLTRSLGLPSDVAARASNRIQHFTSPDRPDSVLHFLRQAGVTESSIRAAVRRDARVLCSTVERNWQPNFAKLREVGLSEDDISGVVARNPGLFRFNFVPKVDYLLRELGSTENVSVVLKRAAAFLAGNLEKVIIPNFSFFRDQLGLSVAQIVRLVVISPRLARSMPDSIKVAAKRAEELGVTCPSPMFLYALVVAWGYNQRIINARVKNLKSLGFSQEEVTTIVSKLPLVLTHSEEMISRKMEFLMKELGLDKVLLVQNVSLFTYSLEKRLIPRSTVRKLLMLNGVPAGNLSLPSFVQPSEKKFLERYVLPYEHAVPGLHRAYMDACSGNVR